MKRSYYISNYKRFNRFDFLKPESINTDIYYFKVSNELNNSTKEDSSNTSKRIFYVINFDYSS